MTFKVYEKKALERCVLFITGEFYDHDFHSNGIRYHELCFPHVQSQQTEFNVTVAVVNSKMHFIFTVNLNCF